MVAERQWPLQDRATIQNDVKPILIVGCGCDHRRDDQIGLRIADALSGQRLEAVRVLKTESPGTDLLTELHHGELLVIADALRADARQRPGSYRRWIVPSPETLTCESLMRRVSGFRAPSSHLLGLAEALILGEQLGLLPPEVWIYAVAAEDFGFGDGLSAAMEPVIGQVAAKIRADVAEWWLVPEAPHA